MARAEERDQKSHLFPHRIIGLDRIIPGAHFMSDIDAREALGVVIIEEMQESPRVQQDPADARRVAPASRVTPSDK